MRRLFTAITPAIIAAVVLLGACSAAPTAPTARTANQDTGAPPRQPAPTDALNVLRGNITARIGWAGIGDAEVLGLH